MDKLIERQLDTDVDSVKYIRFEKMIKDAEQEINKVQEIVAEQQKKIKQAEKRRDALLRETEEQQQYSTMEEYFSSLTLLQRRKLLEKVYAKIVIDTISNAKRGPKKYKIKEIKYNPYSNVLGLCKILGVQDFAEFDKYLRTKGRKLTLIQRYFGDAEGLMEESEKSIVTPQMRKYMREFDEMLSKQKPDEFIEQFMESIDDEIGQMTMEEFEHRFDEALRKYREEHP